MKFSTFLPRLERVTLCIFLGCLFTTAIMVIVSIWTQHNIEAVFMAAATFFIIGLANFLTWLPIILYRLLHK